MESVYIFTHIPKTAGTSIRNHFASYLENHVEFIHLANRGHKQAERQGIKNFYQKPKSERNKAKVILGHQVNKYTKDLLDKEPIEVVIFREPVSWEISRYNQYANRLFKKSSKVLSLADWFNKTNKLHSQFDWFIYNYYKENRKTYINDNNSKLEFLIQNLKNFDYVLFVDKLEDSLMPIFKNLKIPKHMSKAYNKVGYDKKNYFNQTEENIKLVCRECLDEVKIYDKLYKLYK